MVANSGVTCIGLQFLFIYFSCIFFSCLKFYWGVVDLQGCNHFWGTTK